MSAKCCSSSAISAGSALAARLSGRLNAVVDRAGVTRSPIWLGPVIVRHHRGLAASPLVPYTFEVEEQKQAAEFIDTDLRGSRFIGVERP